MGNCCKCHYPEVLCICDRPQTHSKSEYKRLDSLGANPLPPQQEFMPIWKFALIEYRKELQTSLANLEEQHPNNEIVAQALRAKLNAVQECFSRIHSLEAK